MKAFQIIMELVLRVAVSLMIISPIALLLGMRAMVGSPSEVSPEFYIQWSSDHMWEKVGLWSQSAVLYFIGFWSGYYLWRPRSVPLAWWSLLSGVLLTTFVPIGTSLALPCLITLFRKGMLKFWKNDAQAT